MKLKLLASVVLCLFSYKGISQKTKNVNPKGKFYFGAEIGRNSVEGSFLNGEHQNSFQGGLLAEYYFAKHFSLSGRIKYFETDVAFFQAKTKTQPQNSGTFNGAVIAIPLNLKWEFRLYKNLSGSFKGGMAYYSETKSEYSNYSNNPTNLPKQYWASNYGFGLNYFINKKVAVYIDYEGYLAQSSKGHTDDRTVSYSNGNVYHYEWTSGLSYPTENVLLNFGIKYNFLDQGREPCNTCPQPSSQK